MPPPEGSRAQEPKDPPPYGILGAAAVVVAISAVVPIAFLVSSRNTPPPSLVKEPDGAASARVDPRASAPASATVTPPPSPTPAVAPSTSAAAATTPDAEDAGTTAKAADKTEATADASTEPAGPGWLSVATTPLPARVTEKGRVLCTTTPCAKLALSPGEHVLILENKEESVKKRLVVTITSGETIARRVTMKAATAAP